MRADAGPLLRASSAIGLALVLALLVPSLGLGDRTVERAVLALVAFGLVTIATRRPTVFHIVALVQIDNALAVAALAVTGGLPTLIELGVAGDLIVVVLVAALLHARIYAEFGSADTATPEAAAWLAGSSSPRRCRRCRCSPPASSPYCPVSAPASASPSAAAS